MNRKILTIISTLTALLIIFLAFVGKMERSSQEAVPIEDYDMIFKGPIGIFDNGEKTYLTDVYSMPLYVKLSEKNTDGKIIENCDAKCEETWQPYLFVDSGLRIIKTEDPVLSQINIFTRADGKNQYALGIYPLHRYKGDLGKESPTGESVDGWSVAKP